MRKVRDEVPTVSVWLDNPHDVAAATCISAVPSTASCERAGMVHVRPFDRLPRSFEWIAARVHTEKIRFTRSSARRGPLAAKQGR